MFTDRMVFVRAVRENNWMTELQVRRELSGFALNR